MAELTKEYFDQQISKLVTKADFDDEIGKIGEDVSFIKTELKAIGEKVDRIDNRDKEDSNAFAKDIIKLQKDVKQLQLK